MKQSPIFSRLATSAGRRTRTSMGNGDPINSRILQLWSAQSPSYDMMIKRSTSLSALAVPRA